MINLGQNGQPPQITGAWNAEENAWVSTVQRLTGDTYLEVTMNGKSRMVIRKAETPDGPWPKCLKSTWTGPKYKIRIYGSTKYRYIKIYLTSNPVSISFSNTNGYAIDEEDETQDG